MAAVDELRYSRSADNTRPFRSHRYEVYGVKVHRRLTLFGELALAAFIALEADSSVVAYCERPIVIQELAPRRVVDYWVKRHRGEELWLLLRPSEQKWTQREFPPTRAFSLWAETRSLDIRLLSPESIGVGSLYLRNWGEIVRYLTANLNYVDASFEARVAECCTLPRSIGEIEACFPQEDPILVRTTIFRLMHAGALVGIDLDEARLGSGSVVRPV